MAARKKRVKKTTLNEFRAWLEGVEELQPDDWCPNAEQWALIREKIKGIKDEPKVEEKPETVYMNPRQAYPTVAPAAPYGPIPGIAPAPEVGGIPAAPVDMSPAAQQMLSGNGQQATKTPDMDTSDGNVSSPFA